MPVLRAHLEAPLRLYDLRRRLGGAVRTTLGGQINDLRAIGALERRVRDGMPYTVENELTEAGRGVLAVADTVEVWLARAPQGAIALGSESAKAAIRALLGGWGSAILRELASRPLSLAELDGAIAEVNYPSLKRRLSAMRTARQVEQLESQAVERLYRVTEWGRQAFGPLVAAARCECRHWTDGVERPTCIDIEAVLHLAAPLVSLPAAGVRVEIERHEVVAHIASPARDADTWALGTAEAWLDAIIDGKPNRLSFGGGSPELAGTFTEALSVIMKNYTST